MVISEAISKSRSSAMCVGAICQLNHLLAGIYSSSLNTKHSVDQWVFGYNSIAFDRLPHFVFIESLYLQWLSELDAMLLLFYHLSNFNLLEVN